MRPALTDHAPHPPEFPASSLPALRPVAALTQLRAPMIASRIHRGAFHQSRGLPMAERVSAVPVATAAASVEQFAEKTMRKFFGGCPLLQQGELDFSPAEKRSEFKWALAPGCFDARR